jgi:hypothetical protein
VSVSALRRSVRSRHLEVSCAGPPARSDAPASHHNSAGHLERATGIEPVSKAWEAFVLPLNYARMMRILPVAGLRCWQFC